MNRGLRGDVSARNASGHEARRERTRKLASPPGVSSSSAEFRSRLLTELFLRPPLPASRDVSSSDARCGAGGDGRRPADAGASPRSSARGVDGRLAAAASRLCASFWTLSARLMRTSMVRNAKRDGQGKGQGVSPLAQRSRFKQREGTQTAAERDGDAGQGRLAVCVHAQGRKGIAGRLSGRLKSRSSSSGRVVVRVDLVPASRPAR